MKNLNKKFELAPKEKDLLEKLLARFSGKQKTTKEPTGLECDECRKEIAQGDEYFVCEASFAKTHIEDGEMVETKDEAWQTGIMCLKCYKEQKDDEENDYGATLVKDYCRETCGDEE